MPSITPNTRATMLDGVSRATSVKTPTSTRALPTPMKSSRNSATPWHGDQADQRHRQPPERDADAEPPGQPMVPHEHRHGQRAEDCSRADGGAERPDAGLTHVEQVQGQDDGEHRECPAHHRLDLGEHDEHPEVTVAER